VVVDPSLDAAVVLAAAVTEHAVPGAPHGDPAQLLDIDVDELTGWVAVLVPVRRLERLQPRAPPQPEPPQPERDGRTRHGEHRRDLRRSSTRRQSSKRIARTYGPGDVRTLQPAAPECSDRSDGSRRDAAWAAMTVQLYPVPPLELVASTPRASREARMNNMLRNYS
jgi:hypothetical protein